MSHGTILFAALNNTIYFATVPKVGRQGVLKH